jgi:hypothetical protein
MRSIEERKQRWRYLYDGKRKHAVEIVYTPGLPPRPFPLADNLADRGDWALRNYEIMLGQMSWLDSDRIPYLDVYTGTEIFAEAFGCDTYRPKEAMPHAKYLIRSAEEARAIQAPNLDDTTLMRLFEIADRLRREAGSDAIFKLPDIQSPLGIAALIWDKTDFMASLLLYPTKCADSRHQWENFAALPTLRVMNLRIENVRMELDSYEVYGTCCVHMNQRVPVGPPCTWKTHYPDNARAIIRTGAETREEALRLCEALIDL